MVVWASDRGNGRSSGSDPFPWIVTLVSLICVLALFFSSTVQGIREQRELLDHEDQLQEQLERLEREDADLRRRSRQIESNPETVLHEMQRQGMQLPVPHRSDPRSSDGEAVVTNHLDDRRRDNRRRDRR